MEAVALFRMGKRVPVAEHYFRHPGAPRCGQGRHPALFRMLARRQRTGPGGAQDGPFVARDGPVHTQTDPSGAIQLCIMAVTHHGKFRAQDGQMSHKFAHSEPKIAYLELRIAHLAPKMAHLRPKMAHWDPKWPT